MHIARCAFLTVGLSTWLLKEGRTLLHQKIIVLLIFLDSARPLCWIRKKNWEQGGEHYKKNKPGGLESRISKSLDNKWVKFRRLPPDLLGATNLSKTWTFRAPTARTHSTRPKNFTSRVIPRKRTSHFLFATTF